MKLLILIVSFSVFSQDVIDLGSIEVEGEVRRPMVEFVETQNVVSKAIEDVTRAQAENATFYFKNYNSQDPSRNIEKDVKSYEQKVLESL